MSAPSPSLPPSLPPSIHPSLALSFHDTLCCRHRGCWPRSCHALPHTLPTAPTPRLPTPLVTDRITAMPVPLHVRSHHTAASWGGGTRERPAPGWPPSRCAHTLPKQNPPGTRVHDIEACVCGYGRYTAGACSWGLGCPLLVKTARVACCEEWRCSFFVHRASSAPACDSAR